jgi:hypothetical protein
MIKITEVKAPIALIDAGIISPADRTWKTIHMLDGTFYTSADNFITAFEIEPGKAPIMLTGRELHRVQHLYALGAAD